MHLSLIFVSTLAISVILSSIATWSLTYFTSYDELQDMSTGFVGLTTAAVDEFGHLVLQLINVSSSLLSSILTEEYTRSMTQLNETEQELLQTTLDLINQTKSATVQSQGLVSALVVSFGNFMQSAVTEFTAMGTDYASRLRQESAAHIQLIFNDMMQSCVKAVQRPSRLYRIGLLNLSRTVEQPMDDGTCILTGELCSISTEFKQILYVGTKTGVYVSCDVVDDVYSSWSLIIQRTPTSVDYISPQWPPYYDDDVNANFSSWKQSCLASWGGIEKCQPTNGMSYPDYCSGTCGYDPRCRPWYTVHDAPEAARVRMSDVYFDAWTLVPVTTISYPIYSDSHSLVMVTAIDFDLNGVSRFLSSLGSSQLMAVVLNASDLPMMGANRVCPGTGQWLSGLPIAEACVPALQQLGGWLQQNRWLPSSTTLELNGTLWDIFPATVETFSYFVVVGMNKTEVYAVITAVSQASNKTLQNLSKQQTSRMAAIEAAALSQMEAKSKEKIDSLRAMEMQLLQNFLAEHRRMDALFNASSQESMANLSHLTSSEMAAISHLRDYHVSKMAKAVGVTFGAVVGILMGILLFGSYGTWAVTRQVQHITNIIEDVAYMKVEELEVSQKSCVREVQRIEAALGVLVLRLAQYKSYMPSGLFQIQNMKSVKELGSSPRPSARSLMVRKQSLVSDNNSQPHNGSVSLPPSSSRSGNAGPFPEATGPSHQRIPECVVAVALCTRLARRTVTVMAVNVVCFHAEVAQRSTGALETNLNRFISLVHSLTCKAQGNVDCVVGDQVLVTFNAHFNCSDPSNAAAGVALEVLKVFKEDNTFPWRVQIGLAAGPVLVGHLGYILFRTMLTLGAPMKVASLLAHLSGFVEPVALASSSVEERIKYNFQLQPADLVALPTLGEHHSQFAKSITVFVIVTHKGPGSGSQEWLYEVGDVECTEKWPAVFKEIVKAPSTEKAMKGLQSHLAEEADDPLAARLLIRLPLWEPQVGVVLAERPEGPRRKNSSVHGVKQVSDA